MRKLDVVICGAGASGMFCAGKLSKLCPGLSIVVFEATSRIMHKVKISGSGRCNVTSGLFWKEGRFPGRFCREEYRNLREYYPRGHKRVGKSFATFGFEEIYQWFQSRGIELMRESDGRVFPSTNDSQTIIDVIMKEAQDVPIETRTRVLGINVDKDGNFVIDYEQKNRDLKVQEKILSKIVVMAPGASASLWKLMRKLGIAVCEPVPSLFTFKLPRDNELALLSGVSVENVKISVKLLGENGKEKVFTSFGPLLVTHTGLSGPAVLKLSSIAALEMSKCNYRFESSIDWTGGSFDSALLKERLLETSYSKKLVRTDPVLIPLPRRLWRVVTDSDKKWNELNDQELNTLVQRLLDYKVEITAKSTFKEEFVTAEQKGGVELNMLTPGFEVKAIPNLYCIGEFLNIDGVTGGFNFSNCWSSAWNAANDIARHFNKL